MKKLVLLITFIFSLSNQAQENLETKKVEIEKRRTQLIEKREETIVARKEILQERKDKIKALKIAFISQKLALTSEEAEKFWPIYNKYDEKIMVIKEAQLKLKLQKRNLTGEEALKKIEEAEEKEAEVMALKKKMRAELIPVISAEKVLKLDQLEHEFHKKILEKLHQRRENQTPPRR